MRSAPWSGNCLALGLAAGFLEPLESTSIHLIQSGIARFLSMLPRRGATATMAGEFNRQARFEWESVRDFLILHYAANVRQGEPFWDRCRAMPLPDSLAARLDLFRATGYLHREHEELFTEPGWVRGEMLSIFKGKPSVTRSSRLSAAPGKPLIPKTPPGRGPDQ